MSSTQRATVDGNEAVASVAYRTNETIAIYPITPASPMGEFCDDWAAHGKPNLWGRSPSVVEMQSEGGAAGAIHGALQAGSLSTTFTASQGLLLMIPNMYKIAGELTPFCMHVAARTVATHALSIFADHSDVMACRGTGFAMLASGSVQEAQDLACVAHAATLETRVPFLHFFDGFRTSHELASIETLSDDDLRAMLDDGAIAAHKHRALTPDRPSVRGTAQNPDVFFQAREAANPFYDACPETVKTVMQRFADRTGRAYRLFDYVGHPEAERVIVGMGSGLETAHQAVEHMIAQGERVGLVKIRLLRPFSIADFAAALPATTESIAVLDRTKEPGAVGEPLYLDVVAALTEAHERGEATTGTIPRIVGGRFGLSSKEFTPAMVMSVFEALRSEPAPNHFSIGINDDVTKRSLAYDESLDIEGDDVFRAVFFGLGSDGTVGANKNSIKIIGEHTGDHAQAYFVYDSKKAGACTVSHLRFGPDPIRAPYLVRRARFVACHQLDLLDRFDVLGYADDGAHFLLNSPMSPEKTWRHFSADAQRMILEKRLRVHVIDAYKVARDTGVGRLINTIMQTCFFEISGVLPREQATAAIKDSIEKTYAKKGPEIVRRNHAAVDAALDHLIELDPASMTAGAGARSPAPLVPDTSPDFVQRITAMIMAGKGDSLPVSAFPVDGTWPTGTAKWEKRNLAQEIPVWETDICIQCNKCVLACPHAAIRAKAYAPEALVDPPSTFKTVPLKSRDLGERMYALQVAPEDCTGCRLCVMVCPAKDKSNPKRKAINMATQAPLREAEIENYDYFLDLPEVDRASVRLDVKGSQFLEPLFEYSGACAGCGETPYIKVLTQLFGDRLLIANATGCSSIYGGNLPTTPYTVNADGRGPAWSNSLFEDNAEFGFGMRVALDGERRQAEALLQQLASQIGDGLVAEILDADQGSEAGIAAQRARVTSLRGELAAIQGDAAQRLARIADELVDKSVWLVGGDGWAYDIGFAGLDHVMSTNADVNVLVLDTEVYSNTGGQQSKATPLAASAKFAVAGKGTGKKDLGMMAMTYGHVYVARIAFGANDAQTLRALNEAASYPGPSLVIAYSHCIAHGYDLAFGGVQQKLAVDCGVWPLYRFDPRRAAAGKPPLRLDSAPPKIKTIQYMRNEMRFRMAEKIDRKRFKRLLAEAQRDTERRYAVYSQLAGVQIPIFDAVEEPENDAAQPAASEPESSGNGSAPNGAKD